MICDMAGGLGVAVDILKKEKENVRDNEGRSSSVVLLSDGCDDCSNDIVLAERLKSFTKGEGLSFTLNTFGCGCDRDPKIVDELANLRDGGFFLVGDCDKVGGCFVSVLGGCIGVISEKAEVEVGLLGEKCGILVFCFWSEFD